MVSRSSPRVGRKRVSRAILGGRRGVGACSHGSRAGGHTSCSGSTHNQTTNKNARRGVWVSSAGGRPTRGSSPKPSVVPLATKEARLDSTGNVEEAEVEELVGVRLVRDKETGKPFVQYLVKWQDEYEDTWENADDISEDLLRNYEDKWWRAVKTSAYDVIVTMLIGGRDALVSGVDDDRRSALHYACGTGNVKCVKLLLVNGAEVDLRDKEGYTPLHIASGYMHTEVVNALIESGADPEIKDEQGRSALELVESLRDNLPPNNPQLFARRLQLDKVVSELLGNLYDEIAPLQILEARKKSDRADEEGDDEGGEGGEEDVMAKVEAEMGFGHDPAPSPADSAEAESFDLSAREFLVEWPEADVEPTWVPLKHMAEDVVEDFDKGLEYATAERILDKREVVVEAAKDNSIRKMMERRDERMRAEREGDQEAAAMADQEEEEVEEKVIEYLVEWSDGYEASWEPEDHVTEDLVRVFEEERADAATTTTAA